MRHRLHVAVIVHALAVVAAGSSCGNGSVEREPARATSVSGASTVAAPVEPALPGGPRTQALVIEQPDPVALEELLRAAASERPPPTAPDGGTRVGTRTDARVVGALATPPPTAIEPAASAPAPTGPVARVGSMETRPGVSSPAIERAAREQIYWPLVDKCRGPEGEILPPDAITLTFTIRSDGTIDPATVGAAPSDKRFQNAAECVVREFSALPFEGPPASLDQDSRVTATFPSVD